MVKGHLYTWTDEGLIYRQLVFQKKASATEQIGPPPNELLIIEHVLQPIAKLRTDLEPSDTHSYWTDLNEAPLLLSGH